MKEKTFFKKCFLFLLMGMAHLFCFPVDSLIQAQSESDYKSQETQITTQNPTQNPASVPVPVFVSSRNFGVSVPSFTSNSVQTTSPNGLKKRGMTKENRVFSGFSSLKRTLLKNSDSEGKKRPEMSAQAGPVLNSGSDLEPKSPLNPLATENQHPKSETSWIFIPTDSRGKSIGDEYYFPLDLLRRHIQAPDSHSKAQPNGFFFRRVLYTGTLVQNLASRDINIDSIHASFEVEVRIPETKVTFPFTPSQVYLVPGSALLNGESFQVLWENGHPVVNFPKAGRYQLDFTLIPVVAPMEALFIPSSTAAVPSASSDELNPSTGLKPELVEELGLSKDSLSSPGLSVSSGETSATGTELSRSGFRFEIPPVPTARLELQVPSSINSMEFPAALGSQKFEQNSRTWTVHLGAIPYLTVQWKTPVSRASAPSFLTAEELYSWHLKANGQQVECRTRFHSTEEAFSRMEWVVDSGLNFDPQKLLLYIQRENPDSIFSGNGAQFPDVAVGNTTFRQPSYVFVPYTGEKNIQTRFEGKNRRIILTLAQPVNEPMLVVFPLEATSSGNVGTYPLPVIRTEKTKVTHRWFHVIPEPNFQLELFQEQNIPQISVQEFLSVWEELCPFTGKNAKIAREPMMNDGTMSYLNSMVSPNFPLTDADSVFSEIHGSEAELSSVSSFVLDDSLGQSQAQIWKVRSEPLTAISTVQEKLFCAFDKDLVTIQFLVRFSDSNAIPPLFHVQIPENLNIQKVILHDGGQQKNLRFSYTKNRQIGIFYDKTPHSTDSGPDAKPDSEFDSSDGVAKNPGFAPSRVMELPASSLPESIPSPLSKRPSNLPPPPAICLVEIAGTLDLMDFTPKKEIQIPFPDLHVSESALHSVGRMVNLYRSSRVLVTSPLPSGARELEEREAQTPIERHFAFENWRLVSAFAISPQEVLNSTVRLRANQPRVLLNTRTFLKVPKDLVKVEPDGSLLFPGLIRQESGNSLAGEPSKPSNEASKSAETSSPGTDSGDSASPTSPPLASRNDSDDSLPERRLNVQPASIGDPVKENVNDFHEESSVYSANSHWQMTLEMIFTVEKGLADEIVLEMPASISQPYVLEPPMPFELEPISDLEISRDVAEGEKNQKTSTGSKKSTKKSSKSKKNEQEPVPVESASVRNATEISSVNPEGEWVRMIIHPLKPISGNIALRLTADLQETALETSIQNSLVRLSNLRFPGITVKKQDVLLPVFRSVGHNNQFRWLTEGMIPHSSSRLTVPGSAEGNPTAGTNPTANSNPTSETRTDEPSAQGAVLSASETAGAKPSFENPFTRTWESASSSYSGSENPFRIYRVIENQCFAQLQIQSSDWLNPAVDLAVHSIFWNSTKEFLGVTTLDILPQKAQTCVLRIPRKIELLEIHLDSRPVQIEEVVWNPSREEFQPVSTLNQTGVSREETETGKNSDSSNSESRCFRVTLRSLQLPQHLEILYHGQAADWQTFHLPGSSTLPRPNERLFQLDLPVLLLQKQNDAVPIEAQCGAAFFFLPTDSTVQLWSITNSGSVPKGVPPRLASLPSRPWTRVQLLCMERLRDLINRVTSPRFAGSSGTPEKNNWLKNWHLYWSGVADLIEKTLTSRPEFETSEIRQNFDRIQVDGKRFFAEILPEGATGNELLARDLTDFRQNSLWFVFLRNLPRDLKQMTAFETGASSRFYLLETRKRVISFPENIWAVIYTLLFTLMVSLGLYFNPAIPEEVRSTPFWLVCVGSLWLFCGWNVWIGLAVLTLSVLTLAYRIRKIQRRNT